MYLSDCLQNPASLRMLEAPDCPNLADLCEVPDSLQNLSNLRILNLQDCPGLLELPQFPDCIGNLTSLRTLMIRECHSLHSLPELPTQILSLSLLQIWHCPDLSDTPKPTWLQETSDCDIPKPTSLQAVIDCLGYSTYTTSERIHSHEQSGLSLYPVRTQCSPQSAHPKGRGYSGCGLPWIFQGLYPYPDSTAVQGSSNSQKMLHPLQRFEHRRNASCENQEVIIDTQTTNPSTRKRLSTTWNAAADISLEDLEQNYGKSREEAAASLGVSVSTFKRICRKHGIRRWPSSKRKKGKCFLSAQKCNASVQVADGGHASTSQSPNAFSTTLQSFSTSSCVIEALEESSLRSTLSKHKEASMSLNHNMLGTGETTKGNNILQERASAGQGVAYKSQQHKPRNGNISSKSSMFGALEKGSQPPQNGMPCEEDIETSSISRKKRKRLEKEAHYMDPMTHFEGKLPEILNYTSKRQAADGTSKGPSCLSSISWTSGGFNKDSNLSLLSITGHVVDDMDSTRMGVQPCLASMSTNLLSSPSCNENTAQSVKLLFNNLIALPLKDLTDPANEASMKETLSILADNLFLFSEEQAKRIVDLKLEFTSLVHSWREYSRSQMHSQKFFTDLEKTRNMVATSAKDEECLKIRYEELQSKKEELMAQLEAVQKEQDGVAEQRRVNLKQTKHLVSLAEEKASRTKEKHLVMTITRAKLNNLVDQWAAIQSLFM